MPARFVVGKLLNQLDQIHGVAIRRCDESVKMQLSEAISGNVCFSSAPAVVISTGGFFLDPYYRGHVYRCQ